MTSSKPLKEKSCFQWNYYIGKYNREYHLSCECAIYTSKLISVADVKIRMRVLTCTTYMYINNIGPYLIFHSGFLKLQYECKRNKLIQRNCVWEEKEETQTEWITCNSWPWPFYKYTYIQWPEIMWDVHIDIQFPSLNNFDFKLSMFFTDFVISVR